MDINGAKRLGAAIVLQALNDFKQCVKIVKKYPEGSELRIRAEEEMESIMAFARSEWYLDLTTVPQSSFIRKLKELAK